MPKKFPARMYEKIPEIISEEINYSNYWNIKILKMLGKFYHGNPGIISEEIRWRFSKRISAISEKVNEWNEKPLGELEKSSE